MSDPLVYPAITVPPTGHVHTRPGGPGDLLALEELTPRERAYMGQRHGVDVPIVTEPLGWGEDAYY